MSARLLLCHQLHWLQLSSSSSNSSRAGRSIFWPTIRDSWTNNWPTALVCSYSTITSKLSISHETQETLYHMQLHLSLVDQSRNSRDHHLFVSVEHPQVKDLFFIQVCSLITFQMACFTSKLNVNTLVWAQFQRNMLLT